MDSNSLANRKCSINPDNYEKQCACKSYNNVRIGETGHIIVGMALYRQTTAGNGNVLIYFPLFSQIRGMIQQNPMIPSYTTVSIKNSGRVS